MCPSMSIVSSPARTYNASSNEIHLDPTADYLTNRQEVNLSLLHLMIHAFHGTAQFQYDAWEEGFARALSEAMAAGLPIIATPQSGATTLVRDGVEGLIVPARDPGKLAEAILRLARDIEPSRRMGQAAYLRGSARNTWQDYGDRLLEECKRRLDGSGWPRVPQGTQCRAWE